MGKWESEREYHDWLLSAQNGINATEAQKEEARTTPLFSANLLHVAADSKTKVRSENLLPQYGLLANRIKTYKSGTPGTEADSGEDNRLFLNMNAPWSAFICGSQGSGKSHTLSCMLEDGLLRSEAPARLGELPKPLAGIVFHYDKFTGVSKTQLCEAAYLCSNGIPVKVLVSPSNFKNMEKAYTEIEGLPDGAKPIVVPLLLEERHLNAGRMKKLMSVDAGDGPTPLYMAIVGKVLRQLAIAREASEGFDYETFKKRLDIEVFDPKQKAMLQIRLDLLQSFMKPRGNPGLDFQPENSKIHKNKKASKGLEEERRWENEQDQIRQAALAKDETWTFKAGSLTIVDLSCPFLDQEMACALFDMCLSIFLEGREEASRIVALDEAHKFMTGTSSAQEFTDSLLTVIREQRHVATRVIIATQEPTISPKLLDLSSMTIVHCFRSWDWLQMLKSHIAAVSRLNDDQGPDMKELFEEIVALEKGQAFLFAPSALLDFKRSADDGMLRLDQLGVRYLKMRVRNRVTQDGGRSRMATEH